MGPTWVLSAPDGPHVGPMNLTIRVGASVSRDCLFLVPCTYRNMSWRLLKPELHIYIHIYDLTTKIHHWVDFVEWYFGRIDLTLEFVTCIFPLHNKFMLYVYWRSPSLLHWHWSNTIAWWAQCQWNNNEQCGYTARGRSTRIQNAWDFITVTS